MFGIDERLITYGEGWTFVFLIGALLGLRHATDPDHLSALLTLRLNRKQDRPYLLGAYWGVGHAASMIVVGIPIIFIFGELSSSIQKSLEFAVGMVIAFLALRVLWSLITVKVDEHPHTHHDETTHTHPHTHTGDGHKHRSNRSAAAIGLLHGSGGSAGVVALVLSRMSNHWMALSALFVVSIFSGLSMTLCSWLLCRGIDASERIINVNRMALIGSVCAFLFGIWYALAAFEVVPYPL